MATYERRTVIENAFLTDMDYEPAFISGDFGGEWMQAGLPFLAPPEAGRIEPDITGPEGTFEIIVRFTPKAEKEET